MASRFVPDTGAIERVDEMPEVVRDLTRRAVKVERRAKQLAPVDTGRLRSSVTHEVTRDGQGPVAIVGSDVDYAPYQELGTKFQRGTPFLRPALRAAGET